MLTIVKMRRAIFAFMALYCLLSGCSSDRIDITVKDLSTRGKSILLMHPTVNNIKTFNYLVKNGIFPLPEGYRAIGVYHTAEKYDYTQSANYLRNEKIEGISLLKLEPMLEPQSVFKENGCSDAFKQLFETSKGAIFFGGPDIPPAIYGEPTSTMTVIADPYRHYMELSFLFHLLGGNQDTLFVPLLAGNPDYCILGICLGMQSLNVATGGTLYQDIPLEMYNQRTVEEILAQNSDQQHRNYMENYGLDDGVIWGHFHRIAYTQNSFLHGMGNSTAPYVWSSHHQSIEKLGKDLTVAARSMDGLIIESIQHTKFPNVIGVQFHPEVTSIYDANEKMRIVPKQPAVASYIDLFKGDKGEDFHRAFWKQFAERFGE